MQNIGGVAANIELVTLVVRHTPISFARKQFTYANRAFPSLSKH
jgi:hypothetical protein